MMHLPRYVKEYYSHQKVNVASHRELLASTFGEVMENRSYKSKTKRIIFSFWRQNFQRIEKSRTSQQKNITVPKDLMLEIWSDLGWEIYIYHDLREKRIQHLLKHNDRYIRRNTRFSFTTHSSKRSPNTKPNWHDGYCS